MSKKVTGDKICSDGDLDVAIVVARWNEVFTRQLAEGAVEVLQSHGVGAENIVQYECPGSFELPQVAQRVIDTQSPDAVVCLGVVIRGDTPHFEYICSEAAAGIGSVGRKSGIPVTFGVLTCDTVQQARERSGSKAGNKGREAAVAALETANLYRRLEDSE